MTTPAPSARNNMVKILLPVAVILAVVVGGLSVIKHTLVKQGATAEGQPPVQIAEGATLPDIELQQFQGEKVKLSQTPGKVNLINFWATWCEACMVEMPSILKLRAAYKDKGLNVVAISLDDNPDQVLPASLPKMKIDFPVFVDPTSTIASLFEVRAIPLTVIADHNLKILNVEDGERDWNAPDIRAKIEKWLSP